MKKDQYHSLVQFLFARETSGSDWRWEDDVIEPEITPNELIICIQRMNENYVSDLSGFSDAQLAYGYEYVYNNGFSDISFLLRDGPASLETRVSSILSLKRLFLECLEPRCNRSLSHLSQEGNPLNSFCFMLWDITPLTYCEDSPDRNSLYSACAEVMEYSLYLDNPACVESGLHGLGHLEMYYPESSGIVRRYLKSKPEIDYRLVGYAQAAECGNVL